MGQNGQKGQAWQLIAFVAIGLLLHGLLYTTYVRSVGPAHRVSEVDGLWLDSKAAVKVLAVGGSHTRSNVDPAFMPDSLNLGVGGEHYIKTLYRWRYLLEKNDRQVATVLLPLDAAGLSSWKTDDYSPEYIWGRYVDFIDLGRRQKKPFAYGRMWTKSRIFPYAGELETLQMMWSGTKAFKDEDQLSRLAADNQLEVIAKSQRRSGREAATEHLAGHDHADPALLWALRALISDFRDRGTRVVLVSYPMSAGYSKTARDLGADLSAQRALVEQLADPGKVDHVDTESLFHGKPDKFYDGDHLSKVGRTHFSRLLRQKLLALGIR